MKRTLLLHNPNAGDADHYSTDLITAIENEGYDCTYYSIKKDEQWKEKLGEAELLVVAGGDGTVRKVVKGLFDQGIVNKQTTMALLPRGTANNLSKTLSIDKDSSLEEQVLHWKREKRQRFDLGALSYLGHTDIFLEGTGYGVFPALIQTMENVAVDHLGAEEQLQLALEKLAQLMQTATAEEYHMEVDGKTHQGRYLLLEILNIPFIGPNLQLAPGAQIDDGYLDLVTIDESERDAFITHLHKIIRQEKTTFDFQTLRGKSFTIQSANKNIHLDDQYLTLPTDSLTITLQQHVLDFLV